MLFRSTYYSQTQPGPREFSQHIASIVGSPTCHTTNFGPPILISPPPYSLPNLQGATSISSTPLGTGSVTTPLPQTLPHSPQRVSPIQYHDGFHLQQLPNIPGNPPWCRSPRLPTPNPLIVPHLYQPRQISDPLTTQHSNPNHQRSIPISHPQTIPTSKNSYRSSSPSLLVSHNPNSLFLQFISGLPSEPTPTETFFLENISIPSQLHKLVLDIHNSCFSMASDGSV